MSITLPSAHSGGIICLHTGLSVLVIRKRQPAFIKEPDIRQLKDNYITIFYIMTETI